MEEKEKKRISEGLITESLGNGMFRVRLDNEDKDLVLGYISGKIRRSFIRILPGDRVRIEVSPYDLTRGRIIYRLPKKDKDQKDKDQKDKDQKDKDQKDKDQKDKDQKDKDQKDKDQKDKDSNN